MKRRDFLKGAGAAAAGAAAGLSIIPESHNDHTIEWTFKATDSLADIREVLEAEGWVTDIPYLGKDTVVWKSTRLNNGPWGKPIVWARNFSGDKTSLVV